MVLVATEYEDGWSRGMKLETKEVRACVRVRQSWAGRDGQDKL